MKGAWETSQRSESATLRYENFDKNIELLVKRVRIHNTKSTIAIISLILFFFLFLTNLEILELYYTITVYT